MRGRVVLGLVAVVVVVEAVSIAFGGLVDDLLLYLPGIDKVLHAAGFLAIFVVCHRLMKATLPGFDAGALALGLALVVLAAGDELGQGLRSNRSLDLKDFIASVSGVALGVAWLLRPRRPWLALAAGMAALIVTGVVTLESYTTQRHMNAGTRFSRAGDFASARREYRLAYEAGVRSASLFNELGWVEIESGEGDPKSAVEYAAQALAMRPDDADVQDTYGWALHHAGRSAEALPFLERAYRASPDMFCIHYHLGEVYLALGRTETARAHLLKQLERQDTREAARAAEVLSRMSPSEGR